MARQEVMQMEGVGTVRTGACIFCKVKQRALAYLSLEDAVHSAQILASIRKPSIFDKNTEVL